MISVGESNIGNVREKNEDRIFMSDEKFACLPNLYIVADGMGGQKAGEVASELAIECFHDFVLSHSNDVQEDDIFDLLVSALQQSNQKVYEKSLQFDGFEGMGTTFTAATIFGSKLYFIHVGDSRLYLLDSGELRQISNDHTFPMEMYRFNKISLDEALQHPQKHALTRAVGTSDFEKIDTHVESLEDKTLILMCSDGLTTMLSHDEILEILDTNLSLLEKKDKLIQRALENGGEDNISIILIERM